MSAHSQPRTVKKYQSSLNQQNDSSIQIIETDEGTPVVIQDSQLSSSILKKCESRKRTKHRRNLTTSTNQKVPDNLTSNDHLIEKSTGLTTMKSSLVTSSQNLNTVSHGLGTIERGKESELAESIKADELSSKMKE